MFLVPGVNFNQSFRNVNFQYGSKNITENINFGSKKPSIVVEGIEFPTELAKRVLQKAFRNCGQDKLVFRKSSDLVIGNGYILDTNTMTDKVAGCATNYAKATKIAGANNNDRYPWKNVQMFGHTFGVYDKLIDLAQRIIPR